MKRLSFNIARLTQIVNDPNQEPTTVDLARKILAYYLKPQRQTRRPAPTRKHKINIQRRNAFLRYQARFGLEE